MGFNTLRTPIEPLPWLSSFLRSRRRQLASRALLSADALFARHTMLVRL